VLNVLIHNGYISYTYQYLSTIILPKSEKENFKEILTKSHNYTEVQFMNEKTQVSFCLAYISTLVDEKIINESALPYLLKENFSHIEDAKQILPHADVQLSKDTIYYRAKAF
jgi:hypothetical protein